MIFFRPLPWDYGVNNLLRRPGRSLLTLACLTTVMFVVLVVASFVQGLEASLAISGDPDVVLVHALGAAENIENSSIPGRTPALLAANLSAIASRGGTKYISPEVYLGTEVAAEGLNEPSMGLVRGVTTAAPLVRQKFQLIQGQWPNAGQAIVGRLAAAKLGLGGAGLAVDGELHFEGRRWKLSGVFAAMNSALESEIWCPLDEVQTALKRQDLTLAALALANAAAAADVEEFCKERLDLELQATPERRYYAALQSHYRPMRVVAWSVAGLVAAAGALAGLNTMFGAVVGRVRELAALQTLGFSRRAIALSLMQESTLLATAASLSAVAAGTIALDGVAVRFTMGAFELRVDGTAVLVSLVVGIFIGVIGAMPPAVRSMRMPIHEGLKAI